jgi:hypothetical protein
VSKGVISRMKVVCTSYGAQLRRQHTSIESKSFLEKIKSQRNHWLNPPPENHPPFEKKRKDKIHRSVKLPFFKKTPNPPRYPPNPINWPKIRV